MGAIADRLELTLDQVKSYLRVDNNDDDIVIQILLDSAKAAADDYCCNDFEETDDEGNVTELDIPAPIKLWVLKRIARDYERRPEGLNSTQISGDGNISWGSNEYGELKPYRKLPGL